MQSHSVTTLKSVSVDLKSSACHRYSSAVISTYSLWTEVPEVSDTAHQFSRFALRVPYTDSNYVFFFFLRIGNFPVLQESWICSNISSLFLGSVPSFFLYTHVLTFYSGVPQTYWTYLSKLLSSFRHKQRFSLLICA